MDEGGAHVRWVSVATDQGPRACGLVEGHYVDVNAADSAMPSSLRELLRRGPDAQRKAWSALRSGTVTYEPASTRLLPPVPDPRKIICIGLNYRDHAAESGVPVPPEPVLFSKYPTSLDRPSRSDRPATGEPRGRLRGRAGRGDRPGWETHLA